MNQVLGDEADEAQCENCNQVRALEVGVCCEACGAFFCRHLCWPDHWCGPLTDRNGRVVRMGDWMRHWDNPKKTWVVTEMANSFRRYAMCVGVNIKHPEQRIPMHTRLMEIVQGGGVG